VYVERPERGAEGRLALTNKLALIVAVVLGVLSILGIKAYVEKIRVAAEVDQEKMNVLVAVRDIPADRIFTEDDIEEAQFPRQVLEQALRNTWITDRTTIVSLRTKSSIKSGQVLLTSHFHTGVRGGGRIKFKQHERAITVPVSHTGGLAGMLKPQDNIDLAVTMSVSDPAGRKVMITRTLFKGVQILALDSITNAFATSGNYSTLTLALSPRDCNKLLFVLSQGGSLACLLTQPGTPPSKGFIPITSDDLYKEVVTELGGRGRRSGRGR
jgi:Flp pilus assembly protein CpaB